MGRSDLSVATARGDAPPDFSVLKRKPRIGVAWLIVPCLACDFLMLPVVSSLNGPPTGLGAAIALGIVGCVLAQGCLLAAWLAWSDGPFLLRLAKHWGVAVGLYLVWLAGLGLAVAANRVPIMFAATVALGVPLVSIAAQFPLWLARQWFGWRLVRVQAAPASPVEPRLAIRDLMVATLVVAVSLALARAAPSPDKGEVWPIWAVSFAIASVISSIALVPAGALLLRMQPFSRGLAWAGLYAAAWIGLVWIVVAVKWWFAPSLLAPRAIYVGLSSLMLAFAATLMLTGAIARERGYRLMGRNRNTKPEGPTLRPAG
jgi:hypothetical protein